MKEVYGLIGKKLSHSFSKKYFTEKFEKEGLSDCTYNLFELEEIAELPELVRSNPDIKGLNVTIPYKELVIPYLTHIDKNAERIGAVNVIKVVNGALHGYNSDFYGFRNSLLNWLGTNRVQKALVLGTGGASRAVIAALDDISISHQLVSRKSTETMISYDAISPDIIFAHKLIINTTPLGMYPDISSFPQINYDGITSEHYLYDLVYNPLETTFLKKGKEKGAEVKNGLEMLHLQAEKSWELWH